MHALGSGGPRVGELRPDERLADRDRAVADPELVGELGVDPLAVLDELVVAVLEARAGDQRRALAGEDLGPVGLGDAGDAVAVDECCSRRGSPC